MSHTQLAQRALECFANPSLRKQYFDLYSDDIVFHGYGLEAGLNSVKAYYAQLWAAFPDAVVDADEMIESGDKLVIRFVLRATHRGPFLGVEPMGKPVVVPGITILRFDGDKCVERWSVVDGVALLAQLGALGSRPA